MADIRSMLAALARLQKATGATNEAKDTAVLSDLATAGDLTERIEKLDLVVYFLGELRASQGNKARFDQALKDMRKPGLLTEAQAKAIARQFLSTSASFRNKAAAIEAIRDARARDDRLHAKLQAS